MRLYLSLAQSISLESIYGLVTCTAFMMSCILHVASAKAEAAPRQVHRVDLGGARSFDRPDRGLELPMSPIGKPSSLELLDASASLSFYADDQPKVSTQKIPHQTHLDSFGLRLKERATEEQQQAVLHSTNTAGGSLCMTESVFPKAKQSQHVKQHHCRQVPKKVTATHSNANAASWKSFCEVGGFGDKEKSITHAAKQRQTSFDQEVITSYSLLFINNLLPRQHIRMLLTSLLY